jgi:hypothetical protein
VQRAGDPRAYPEQIELGLEPWSVRRVYGRTDEKTAGLVQDCDEPKSTLRASPADFATMASGLLNESFAPLRKRRVYQRLSPRPGKDTTEVHPMTGLEKEVGEVGESKRQSDEEEPEDKKLAQTLSLRRTAQSQAANLDDPARALALVPVQLAKLPEEHAAPAAFAIASQFARAGQWYLAQEVYLYLVDRYPYHPLSAQAYRWLIRLNSSGEARRRNDLKQFAIAEQLAAVAKKDAIQKVGLEEGPPEVEPLTTNAASREWNKGSLLLSKRLAHHGAMYQFEPATQLCLQAARRQLGEGGEAQKWLTTLTRSIPLGPIHEAARSELWLADPANPRPRRIGRCRFTEVRPYLDGKFDDPCWQDWKPMILDNSVGETASNHRTEAMFAWDPEFLYVALKCQHPTGGQVAPVKPRPRDAQVDPFDRVSILFDIDRDYATYYHLEVDQRGCVRDSCWGDRGWNPRWFVAVHSTQTCWQIEAAIPLGELTGERITQTTAWAFNLVRILPGRGVQSWSLPADVRPCPEGMSLLLFQTGTAKVMSQEP